MSRGTSCLVALLAALCAAQPSAAFLHDLLLQPLHQIQHAVQPQQPPPQYYQYQYRRAINDAPPPPLPVQNGVYSNSRPVFYQWQPSSSSPSYGSGYSYSSNPFASLLQNPWFSWSANRQPQQQQLQQLQQQQPQQQQQLLSAPLVASQPPQQQHQQPQQPLQAFWALLPWNSNSYSSSNGGGGQQSGAGTPVLSFLQNQAALLPWAQQGSRPGVVYTTPLAPSSAHLAAAPAAPAAPAVSHLQLVAEAPSAPAPASAPAATLYAAPAAAAAAPDVAKPLDEASFQVEDSLSIPSTAELASNGVRRIALQHVSHDGLPCA